MVQIINDPGRWATSGFLAGQEVGEGLAALASQKVQQLQDRGFQKDLVSKGYSPQEAEYITFLRRNNPQQYQNFKEFELRNIALNQQPVQQAYSQQMQQQPQVPLAAQVQQQQPAYNQAPRLEDLFSSALRQPLGEQSPLLKQIAQQLPNQVAELPQAQPSGIQALPQYQQQQAPELQQAMASQLQPQVSPISPVPGEILQEIEYPEVTKSSSEQIKEQRRQSKAEEKAAKIKQHLEAKNFFKEQNKLQEKQLAQQMKQTDKKIEDIEKPSTSLTKFVKEQGLPLTKDEMARQKHEWEREKVEYERKNRQLEDIKEGHAETKDFSNEISASARAANNNNMRLKRMEELIPDVDSPQYINTLRNARWKIPYLEKEVGIDPIVMMNASSQEFDKLSKDFLKDAKPIFGARMTDFDLENFFKTVPDLLQSTEGKMRIIRNLRLMNDAILLRNNALREIRHENGGYRPWNIEELIEERIEPELDRISQEFIAGLPRAQAATKKAQEERQEWLENIKKTPKIKRLGPGLLGELGRSAGNLIDIFYS